MRIRTFIAGAVSASIVVAAIARHVTKQAFDEVAALRTRLLEMTADRNRWRRAVELQERSAERHLRLVGE